MIFVPLYHPAKSASGASTASIYEVNDVLSVGVLYRDYAV